MKYTFETILSALVADIVGNDIFDEIYRVQYHKGKPGSITVVGSYESLLIGFANEDEGKRHNDRVRIEPGMIDRMKQIDLSPSSEALLAAIKQGQDEIRFKYDSVIVYPDELYFMKYAETDKNTKCHVVFWNEWLEA